MGVLSLVSAGRGQDPQPPESPRALLERGAYAEEHQRSFEEAAKLYAQAEAAAKAAGDDATAKEAAAARSRVAQRMGQVAPPAQDDDKDPIAARIADLLSRIASYSQNLDQDEPVRLAAISDLGLFEARAVPALERMLSGESFFMGTHTVRGDTSLAAELLARMREPEATRALERGIESPDPLTRSAIATALQIDPERHRPLLESLARDPVSKVRSAAFRSLSQSEDPSLQPLMEAAVKSGETEALSWMAWRAGARLFELVIAAGTADELRVQGLAALGNTSSLPAHPDKALALLELARSSSSQGVRAGALACLMELFGRHWKAEIAIQEQIETEVLTDLLRWERPAVFLLLHTIGSVRTLEALAKAYGAGRLSLPANDTWGAAEHCFRGLLARTQLYTFESLSEVFRGFPAPGADASPGGPARNLFGTLASRLQQMTGARTPPNESIAQGFDGLDEEHRLAYRGVLEARVTRSKAATPGSLDPVLLPALTAYLQDPRDWVLNGIAACGDVRAIEFLLPHTGHETAARGIMALARRNPQLATEIVESAIERDLREGEPDARTAGALGLLQPTEALAAFERLWPRAQSEIARTRLLETLVRSIPGAPATASLLDHYRDIPSSSASIRQEAVRRFGAELFEPAIPTLGEALKDPEEPVRSSARHAFKAFKEHREALDEFAAWMQADRQQRESIAELMKLLESANRDVAIGAVRALAAVKARSALPALVKLLEKPDPDLKRAVQEALTRIGE